MRGASDIYSLVQSKRVRGAAGEPLPVVFKSLEAEGFQFQRGQLVLVAAAPGTGKSVFALTLALMARVPTIYLSADSDAFTQRTRSMSIVNGIQMEEAVRAELNGMVAELEQKMVDIPLRFCFDASPSLDTIELELAAYYEVFAEYPHLIIVDNVTNVRTGTVENDENPFAGMEGLMDYLHSLARETGACILGLHHVTGPYNDGGKPIPLSGLKGQVARVPEAVLMLSRSENNPWGSLSVSVVKNRGGKADPFGVSHTNLHFDGSSVRISEEPE